MKNAYMYGCPKCKVAFCNKSDEPEASVKCPNCNVTLEYLGCTKEQWTVMSDEEKAELKAKRIPAAPEIAKSESFIPQMAADIKTIKNIMVFALVISILSFVLTILGC